MTKEREREREREQTKINVKTEIIKTFQNLPYRYQNFLDLEDTHSPVPLHRSYPLHKSNPEGLLDDTLRKTLDHNEQH